MFTGRGLVRAKYVTAGDFVLSEDGRLHRVHRAWSTQTKKKAVRLFPFGWTQGVGVTVDHQMLTRRDGELVWVSAGELQAGDKLLFRRPKEDGCFPRPISNTELTPGFCRFLGYFLGDGCLGRGDSYIHASFGDPSRYLDDYIALVKDEFDRKVCVDGPESCRRGRFGHRALGYFLGEHFYEGMNNGRQGGGGRLKFCPAWVVPAMDDSCCREFIVGLMQTDGCFSLRKGRSLPDASFKQVSPSVTQAFFLACARIGLHPSMDWSEQTTREICGRAVSARPFWKVRFAGADIITLMKLCGMKPPKMKRHLPQQYSFDGDWFETPIRKIKNEDAALVYDFAIEDVHSFSMPWATAHNCWETVERCTRRCFNDPEHGSCPIYTFCKGKAHHCDGFIPTEDFVDKVRLIDRERFEVEWLNQRPARDRLVYSTFDNARHVMTPERLFSMSGVAYPHAIWQRVSGLDFGAGPGHPFVYLKLAQIPNTGAWLLFHEYAAEQRLMSDHAKAIKSSPFWAPNEWIFSDWSAQERIELQHMRIRCRPATKDVLMGIDYVRSLFRGFPPAEVPMLYIWHECSFVIGEFGLYRWPSHPDGRIDRSGKPLKVNDHSMDALRYALYSFKHKPSRKYRVRRMRGI